MESILIVEDTESLRKVLCSVLSSEGYQVTGTSSAEEGLECLAEHDFTLILSDLKLPNKSGLDFLKESKEINKLIPVVVMTAYGSIDIAVEAMKLGASDFITKPFDPDTLVNLLGQIAEHRRIIDRGLSCGSSVPRKILTQSSVMENVLEQARKVAVLNTSVLVLGESGTGKELVARYIHEISPRADKAFVAVNCGSMPGELLESEFFGHEAGSFTGATERRIGLFEVASDGTIFLDEIGAMPHALQVKLLRTLQESEVKRVGSTTMQKINTRVVSATNANIEDEIRRGSFRNDLYYRLSVVVIDLPPLRERKGDVSLLANYFIKRFSDAETDSNKTLTKDAIARLECYHWPGNVRELENVIERAIIFNDGPITAECLKFDYSKKDSSSTIEQSLPEISHSAAKEAEIDALRKVLNQTGGNKSQAAKILRISYKTLLNKVKEYGVGVQAKRE